MSLLTTATLVVTPNANKTGKLYSVIPSNGNGDFTVTRATEATRTNSAGLIEVVPYNLLNWSEMFSDATWTKGSSSITANTTIAPNGTLTADTLTADGLSFAHYVSQNSTLSNNIYSYSVYAKAGTNNFFQIRGFSAFGSPFINFDLNNGILGTSSVGVTGSITSVGDGWYRCIMTFTPLSATTGIGLYIVTSASAVGGEPNTLSTSVFLWGAQLVEGTTAKDYLRTETRLNIPRLDYSLGGCPNLLLEPQRTNLALRSEEFDLTTPWTTNISGTGVAPTRTANAVVSPSGVQNADTILFNRGAGNTGSDFALLSQGITVPTTGTYYFSVWMKATTSGDIGKQVLIRCGNSGTLQPFTLTANWTRYETTASVTSGSVNSFQIGNRGTFTTGNSVSVDLWGAQLEAGAYATSYIPTTTASVTRNADSISLSNVFTNGLISASGGTWFVELRNNIAYTSDSNIGGIFLDTASFGYTNGFILRKLTNGRLVLQKYIATIGSTLHTTTTDTTKVAIKWNGITADVFVNGTKVVTATAFTTTAMQFLGNTTNPLFANINQMALWATPLTDTQLTQLTTL